MEKTIQNITCFKTEQGYKIEINTQDDFSMDEIIRAVAFWQNTALSPSKLTILITGNNSDWYKHELRTNKLCKTGRYNLTTPLPEPPQQQ